jgi:hypothetical protein
MGALGMGREWLESFTVLSFPDGSAFAIGLHEISIEDFSFILLGFCWRGSGLVPDRPVGDPCDLLSEERRLEVMRGDVGREVGLQFAEDFCFGENAS